MQNNIYYFEYSRKNPEHYFDPFYIKNKIVIPNTSDIDNKLTRNNQDLIDYITTFETLTKTGKKKEDAYIAEIIEEIIRILDNTDNINYSAFCQFFMVYNASFSSYQALKINEKYDFIYDMLVAYCKERHDMYKSHGYSNIVLQVVCDNYSHKRNSKTTIDKILSYFDSYNVRHVYRISDLINGDNCYILPDKGDEGVFDDFLRILNIKMESRLIEQSKRPDVVFKHKDHYYIFELKTMKGSGGGQNKQAVEFAYFLRFSEENKKIHYGVFLDSLYANTFFCDTSPKIAEQRYDVEVSLKSNPGNYFLNTEGMKMFLEDVFLNKANNA